MSRVKKQGRFLNAKVSDEVFKRVEEYSKMSLLPKTAIVELALQEYLDRNFNCNISKNSLTSMSGEMNR